MNNDVARIKSFMERVYSLNFVQRLFSWHSIKKELMEVSSSLNNLNNQLERLQEEKNLFNNQIISYTKDQQTAQAEIIRLRTVEAQLSEFIRNKETEINRFTAQLSAEQADNDNLEQQLQQINTELGTYRERVQQTEKELNNTKAENIKLQKEEEFRKARYSEEIAALQNLKEQVQQERQKEVEEKQQEELERLRKLKETWFNHQADVQNKIKSLCQKHTISYLDKVSFKGDPDNTLFICEEHVIFDAKSPASDDLTNFPAYLKDQAEKAKKYARQENVKTDIFFVVPTNTLQIINQFVYNLADYNVFVISLDALEPTVLSLCKIEEYEFAEQLSPEERENICRILGKFAHLSKRRIQIDSFFAKQFIELAYKCENSLPADIHDKVLEFEKAEKLNPPQEKRVKAISTKELETDAKKIETEANAKGILIPNHLISTALNDISLYKSNL